MGRYLRKQKLVIRSLLGYVKKRKLSYFRHIMRKCGSLEKEIVLGTLPGQRHRGRPRMSRLDNITAWTQSTLEMTGEIQRI